MHTLKPYPPEKAKFFLEAEAHVSGTHLVFEYQLDDQAEVFLLPKHDLNCGSQEVKRADGLWNYTCFEAFLNPLGHESYYEFNFSLQPAWNLYRFDQYRFPQPPQVNEDFLLQSYAWDSSKNSLKIELKNNSNFKKFNIGLTAVLETRVQEKHYYALVHAGAKPDFHLQKSFTLVRG